MTRDDVDEFVSCYRPENRNKRKPAWDEAKNPEGRARAAVRDSYDWINRLVTIIHLSRPRFATTFDPWRTSFPR